MAPSGGRARPDARSLIAAGLCILALFFDVMGWILAIAGVVLLRRAVFSRRVKGLLATVALAPKILFIAVRSLNAPEGLSFVIEPRNLATSPSLWAWCVFLAAFGVFLMVVPQPVRRRRLVAALGIVPVAAAAVVLLGLLDGFHRIDDAGGGRWALRHAARGEVAVFSRGEVVSVEARERPRRLRRYYTIQVKLTGGRSFSATAQSFPALDELRKFAATADLPGKVRIISRSGGWTSGHSGFRLKDCVGRYEPAGDGGDDRSTFEFWLDQERLVGRETVADERGRRVRMLRNVKLSETGAVEFDAGSYMEASGTKDGTISFSLNWSSGGEAARFVKGGLEIGTRKYNKR